MFMKVTLFSNLAFVFEKGEINNLINGNLFLKELVQHIQESKHTVFVNGLYYF